MKKLAVAVFIFLSLGLKYGWSDESIPLVWESSYTKTPPIIDGKMDEVWEKAKPLIVTVREAMGGDNPKRVVLRALHTDDTFYMVTQWPDNTKSDMRDPYVWNAEKEDYERPSKPDDQFSLEFPMTGEFDIRMLTLVHEYTADVWHWKAGRGNPVGWADDKRHIISQKPIQGGMKYTMGVHGKVYIARIPDEGISSYHLRPKPKVFEGEIVNSFNDCPPTGSLADVRGKGIHDGKAWTLEMSRKFNTGHNDDAVIDSAKDNICAIAVLDDELYWEHSVSSIIILRFISEETTTNPKSRLWNFDKESVGKLPKGFSNQITGGGNPSRWEIIDDNTAPSPPYVLAQTSTETLGYHFNLVVIEDTDYSNLELGVKFKAVSGREDQGGGPVWRYQDPDNYYIARANPLENNFRVYKVVNGSRKQLDSVKIKVTSGEWHTIRIINKDDKIQCYYDAKLFLEVSDNTFKKGKIGLWTKADAVTYFDDLEVERQ
ncbi:MAG: ethylbenzene dehydrogenase-related protein [Candidatus Brocadiales bacterium]